MTLRIGIDLGGTKIEGIALDGSREVARLRVPTPRDDYDATLDAIVSLTIELETRTGGRGTVGVGIPGAISPSTGLVKNANSVWLIGRPLRRRPVRRAWRASVRIANDANCFAVSEAADGAAAGAAVVFGVILGTGTGAGIVVRGAPLVGANAIAGEWGHIPLPWADAGDEPQPECYCGKRGCVETYLSGPALAADHERRAGVRYSVPEILARAASSDARRRRHAGALRLRVRRAVWPPSSTCSIPTSSSLAAACRTSTFSTIRSRGCGVAGCLRPAGESEVRTRLVRARHGDSSGVRGAAWLWPDA